MLARQVRYARDLPVFDWIDQRRRLEQLFEALTRRRAQQGRPAEHKAMIDRTHDLPIKRQAELLNIGRGTVYYQPEPVSPAQLGLMRRIDELHLEHPFAGSR